MVMVLQFSFFLQMYVVIGLILSKKESLISSMIWKNHIISPNQGNITVLKTTHFVLKSSNLYPLAINLSVRI